MRANTIETIADDARRIAALRGNTAMLLRGKRIFIIEDNIHNRLVYNMALTGQGASIYFDPHGRDPEWRLRAMRDADLIILDLMLWRGQSGFDLFDEIRNQPEIRAIPIIAVSAAEPAVAVPKARQMGFSGFIAKPIDDEHFAEQIARVIAGEEIWYTGERF